MATNVQSFADLSDRDLIAAVHHLAADERRVTASLVESLAKLPRHAVSIAPADVQGSSEHAGMDTATKELKLRSREAGHQYEAAVGG
jgi:hypothetical protein